MYLLGNTFVVIVALLHFYFLVLEMFLWTTPKGLKVFRQTLAQAQATKVLAANQGLYNGFLAVGLLWGLCHPHPEVGFQFKMFFLGCVVVAGVYGGYSVNRKILFIQAVPAALALVFFIIA